MAAIPPRALLAGRPLGSLHWLFPDTPGVYHADPFLLEQDGRRFLYCERFDWRASRGEIVVGELIAAPEGWRLDVVRPLPVLAGGHVSYPCLLRHQGEVFMVPETADRGRVDLYRARRLPADWVREATLLPDFPGVDATPFRAGDRFWMLAGRAGGRENRELHAFHAPALTGPWRAVTGGPVVRDAGTARMAGAILSVDGDLIRPAQDCRGTYGRRIILRRIDVLEPSRFRESTVGVVDPRQARPYDQGVHTIGFAGDLAVIDGKRYLGPRRCLGPLYAAARRGASGARP